MPGGMCLCHDCMQKSFDSFNSGFGGGNGIQFLDLSNMDFNNLKDMNLGELLSGNLSNQKPKTKKATHNKLINSKTEYEKKLEKENLELKAKLAYYKELEKLGVDIHKKK